MLSFSAIFLLGMDYWNWNHTGVLWMAWPSWAWYFVLLSAAQTVLMLLWVKPAKGLPA